MCLIAEAPRDDYNSHIMKAVNIADLKANLSSYLQKVLEGQEIVVRSRQKPIARIIPFETRQADAQELKLVSEGKLKLPKRKTGRLFWKQFWALERPKVRSGDAVQAVIADRNER